MASRARRCLFSGALRRHLESGVSCGPGKCFQCSRPSFCAKRLSSPSGSLCIPGRHPARPLVTSRFSQNGISAPSLDRSLTRDSVSAQCVSVRRLHEERTRSASPRGATGAASWRRHAISSISTAALPSRGLSNYLPSASWQRPGPGRHLGDGANRYAVSWCALSWHLSPSPAEILRPSVSACPKLSFRRVTYWHTLDVT